MILYLNTQVKEKNIQMKRKINLFWYKHNEGKGNFGDELNPYILEHLTGKNIQYLPIPDTRIRRVLKMIKGIIQRRISFKDIISVLKSLKYRKYYVVIGSVISWVNGRHCHVWGAGLMNKNDEIKKCKFHAVRGEITRKKIKDFGFNIPPAIGDPALLLPIIYQPNSEKKYDLGIIPHYVQMPDLLKEYERNKENVLIIDLLNDIETVLEQINSCEKTISSSLHGLIVSHAYGIPSLWCNLGKTSLAGDDIKFDDYFSSVNIPFYKRREIDLKRSFILQSNNFFREYSKHSLINNDINKIQTDLLKHAPFEILDKFKKQ